MPTLITELSQKQVLAEAKAVVASYCIPEVISARMSDAQGMFSRTAVVTLEDDTEVVVQLKDNEIDTTKVALAHSILGDVVPLVQAAPTTKAYFAYVAPFIPGTMWADKNLTDVEEGNVAAQIGMFLGKCYLGLDSRGMVDSFVIPRLRHILAKEKIEDTAIVAAINSLISSAETLKVVPLALCHWDINKRNVLLNDSLDVAALIDWEQANLLPLGMNAWCIRYLSVPIVRGRDVILDNSAHTARPFWDALIANIPSHLHPFKRNIVTSMQVGFVLQTFWAGGAPNERNLEPFLERLNWIKSTFEPFCVV